MKKVIRITTVPSSLRTLLKGQLKFMSKHYEIIGIASKGEPLNEVEQNEGVRTYAINMTRTITPFKDLIATYKLYRFFKKEKPFIVHTHTPKAGTLGMIASRLAKVPHRLHTVAGMPLLETTGFKRKVLDLVEKITYKNASFVLPNSFGLYDIIIKNRLTNKEKLIVIGNGSSNGIETSHFDAKLISDETKKSLMQDLGVSDTDFIFIFIGRIVKDKGINELVKAFEEISNTNKNCKLLLVGPKEDHLDPLLPETELIIKSNKNILAVGVQKDIRPYVSISNALVFPSYREGFPNVVLQASAMGLPCIVSNINGCNEIIEDGFNGKVIPPKDLKALINTMKYIMSHPKETQQMADNARDNIVKKYQQEYIWNALLEQYKRLERSEHI